MKAWNEMEIEKNNVAEREEKQEIMKLWCDLKALAK